MDGAPRWLLLTLGYGGCAIGAGVLAYAFLLWVGIGLDKQHFDAGTITYLIALGVIPVSVVDGAVATG
jgi:hypothetical protein